MLDLREIPTVQERFADAGRVASNSVMVFKQEIMDVANDMEDMEIENLESSVQIKIEKEET